MTALNDLSYCTTCSPIYIYIVSINKKADPGINMNYIIARKILDDLSAADQTLQKTSSSELMSSSATLQAQQLQAALQQVASNSGLTSTSILPGLFQGGTSTASNGDQLSSQLSVMLPAQQQVILGLR